MPWAPALATGSRQRRGGPTGSTWEYSALGFQVNTSAKATGMAPVTANQPPALGLAAGFWSILSHPRWRQAGGDLGSAGTQVGDLAGEMEKTAVRAAASGKGCRREGQGMKSKRQCRKEPKSGPRRWGAQSTPLPLPGEELR